MAATGKTGKRRVKFALRANPDCKVFVAGTFNGWDAAANRLTYKAKDGLFSATLTLTPGRYEYKFVVDGIWGIDPEQTEWVPNDMGSLNSVIHVV